MDIDYEQMKKIYEFVENRLKEKYYMTLKTFDPSEDPHKVERRRNIQGIITNIIGEWRSLCDVPLSEVVQTGGKYRANPHLYAVAWLCRNALPHKITYYEIGDFFKKDHATIMYWTVKCEEKMEKNDIYASNVKLLKIKLSEYSK